MGKQQAAGGRGKQGGQRQRPVGVWNRGRGSGPANPIRVRTKRLDEIDGEKRLSVDDRRSNRCQ
jgi:hypothetical protein